MASAEKVSDSSILKRVTAYVTLKELESARNSTESFTSTAKIDPSPVSEIIEKMKPMKKEVVAMREEVVENLKNPVKVQKFIDMVNQTREELKKQKREIKAMMTEIPAPKGTKAQIIELIREMVEDPVDRLKLRLEKRDKGTLQTIYIDTKATYDWHTKNEPGKSIQFNLDF